MLKKLLPIIFGALAALPIAFPQIGILQWILLVPFALFCFSEITVKGRKLLFGEYLAGFAFFFGYYLVCYSWFFSMYPLSVTGIPQVAAFAIVCLAAVGIPAFQAVGFGIILPAFRFAYKKGLPKGMLPLLMGALWCVCEWLQGFFWFGIPWVRMALGQIEMPSLFRSVNLFGSYFVTFLIVAVNFYIAFAIKEGVKKKRQLYAFSAAVIFFANAFYGALDIKVAANKPVETLRISAFQGNISTEEKWSSHMLERSFEIYDRLAKEACEAGAEYVIFPETVFPYVTENHPEIDIAIKDMAWKYDMTLMVGTFGLCDGDVCNVIRVYEPMRDGVCVYSKQKPVPFGEYVPMRDLIMTVFPFLGEINMLNRALAPGMESSVWQDDNAIFGYMICFDSIYDHIARESANNGARVLMISTNDSWFGDSVGTKMHSAQAKLRAVENGRSVVRAANTGISSIITPAAETLELIECDTIGQITADVPLSDDLTLYTRIGNLFVYICIIFTVFCMIPRKIWNKITVRSS